MGNMHKKFGEDRVCSSGDMIAYRQTDTVITILRSPIGRAVAVIMYGGPGSSVRFYAIYLAADVRPSTCAKIHHDRRHVEDFRCSRSSRLVSASEKQQLSSHIVSRLKKWHMETLEFDYSCIDRLILFSTIFVSTIFVNFCTNKRIRMEYCSTWRMLTTPVNNQDRPHPSEIIVIIQHPVTVYSSVIDSGRYFFN